MDTEQQGGPWTRVIGVRAAVVPGPTPVSFSNKYEHLMDTGEGLHDGAAPAGDGCTGVSAVPGPRREAEKDKANALKKKPFRFGDMSGSVGGTASECGLGPAAAAAATKSSACPPPEQQGLGFQQDLTSYDAITGTLYSHGCSEASEEDEAAEPDAAGFARAAGAATVAPACQVTPGYAPGPSNVIK